MSPSQRHAFRGCRLNLSSLSTSFCGIMARSFLHWVRRKVSLYQELASRLAHQDQLGRAILFHASTLTIEDWRMKKDAATLVEAVVGTTQSVSSLKRFAPRTQARTLCALPHKVGLAPMMAAVR